MRSGRTPKRKIEASDFERRDDEAIHPRDVLPTTPAQTAAYIASLAGELKGLANQSGMPFLAYLLSLAEEEANLQKQRGF